MNRAQERRLWQEHFFPGTTKKESKFKNEKVVDASGRKFDSKREAKRAGELELMQKMGKISDLKYQVRFEIVPQQGKRLAAYYIADFTFVENGQLVVADAKGCRTREFILKSKLMLQVHGITVREV
jgi:hypothetical protein